MVVDVSVIVSSTVSELRRTAVKRDGGGDGGGVSGHGEEWWGRQT